eukprot:2803731-Rhodomonas_salina.2
MAAATEFDIKGYFGEKLPVVEDALKVLSPSSLARCAMHFAEKAGGGFRRAWTCCRASGSTTGEEEA